MLMDHIPRCPCSHYVIRLYDRNFFVLEEFVVVTGRLTGGTCLWSFAESGIIMGLPSSP
jgi:hypothetical protein